MANRNYSQYPSSARKLLSFNCHSFRLLLPHRNPDIAPALEEIAERIHRTSSHICHIAGSISGKCTHVPHGVTRPITGIACSDSSTELPMCVSVRACVRWRDKSAECAQRFACLCLPVLFLRGCLANK